MRFIIFLSIGLLFFTSKMAIAQSKCVTEQDTILHKQVYTSPTIMPEPLIGFAKLNVAIGKDIRFSRAYQEFQGRVYVAFVIERNGVTTGFRVVKDIANEKHFFANQIIKTIRKYKWKPGMCSGKPVPVLFTIPFYIGIQE